MNRPRLIFWLRVAVSAFCLALFVGVILLWGRSHNRADLFHALIWNDQRLFVCSMDSRIYGAVFSAYAFGTERHKLLHVESGPSSLTLRSMRNAMSLVVPHYLIAIMVAAFAVLPWTGSIRWRFSIRSLLILTTIVAIVLGLIVWAMRPRAKRDEHELPANVACSSANGLNAALLALVVGSIR